MFLTRRGFMGQMALAAGGVLAGTSGLTGFSGAARAASQLTVSATTGMIADTASVIGGNLASVSALMGPGVDPHGYRQTRSDIVAMARADLVLRHGLHLEAQMEEFFADLSRKGKVVAVADGIDPSLLLSHPEYPGRYDPHVWMDPELWKTVSATIASALKNVLPDQAGEIDGRLGAFLGELDGLDAYAMQVLDSVPESARVLVTAHDAFSYFGRAYGFEVLGIQGISTESEAGLSRIAELVDTLVERRIGAVFVESSVPDRNMKALIEGADARGHKVIIGGELFSDAMGQSGTYEGTYLGMIDHNVTTIAAALGGKVPERGRLGKLQAAG